MTKSQNSYRVVYGESSPAWEQIFPTMKAAKTFAKEHESFGDVIFSIKKVVPGEAPQSMTAAINAAMQVTTQVSTRRIADLFVSAIESGDPVTTASKGGWCYGIYWKSKATKPPGGKTPWYDQPALYERKDFQVEVWEVADENAYMRASVTRPTSRTARSRSTRSIGSVSRLAYRSFRRRRATATISRTSPTITAMRRPPTFSCSSSYSGRKNSRDTSTIQQNRGGPLRAFLA